MKSFTNYFQQIRSFQQRFIWAIALFRRFLHTYICFDIYPGTVDVEAIVMYLNEQILIIGHLNGILSLKISVLRDGRRTRRC